MTTRKHIKQEHRLQRDAEKRNLEQSRRRRTRLRLGAAAIVISALAVLAFVLVPWSGSGDAEENLPSLTLSIGDNFFEPDTLRLQAGQKYSLNIRNQGASTHDVWMAGSDNKTSTGDDIRTDPIPAAGAATEKIKYDNPGTYYFVCTFHAGQGGTIIVEEPATAESGPR